MIVIGHPGIVRSALRSPIVRRGVVASGDLALDSEPILLLDLIGIKGFSGSPVVLEQTGETIGVVYGPGPISREAGFEIATPVSQLDYKRAVGAQ